MANRLRGITNPRVYKLLMRERNLSCSYCPPHRKENGHWVRPRKKKEYQLTPRQLNWL